MRNRLIAALLAAAAVPLVASTVASSQTCTGPYCPAQPVSGSSTGGIPESTPGRFNPDQNVTVDSDGGTLRVTLSDGSVFSFDAPPGLPAGTHAIMSLASLTELAQALGSPISFNTRSTRVAKAARTFKVKPLKGYGFGFTDASGKPILKLPATITLKIKLKKLPKNARVVRYNTVTKKYVRKLFTRKGNVISIKTARPIAIAIVVPA